MKSNKMKIIILSMAFALASGCSTKPKSCSDKEMVDTLLSVANSEIYKSFESISPAQESVLYGKVFAKDSLVSINDIITEDINKPSRRITCKATVIVSFNNKELSDEASVYVSSLISTLKEYEDMPLDLSSDGIDRGKLAKMAAKEAGTILAVPDSYTYQNAEIKEGMILGQVSYISTVGERIDKDGKKEEYQHMSGSGFAPVALLARSFLRAYLIKGQEKGVIDINSY